MAIRAANAIASFSRNRACGITPDNIIAGMDEIDVYPAQAAETAMQAIDEGLARVTLTYDAVYNRAKSAIAAARALTADMQRGGHIAPFPADLLRRAWEEAAALAD